MDLAEKGLTSFFEEQAKLEKEIVRSMKKALETLTNPIVKGVLIGISLDSLKHAEIYKAITKLASNPPALTEEEFRQLRETIRKHIKYEEKAIEGARYGIQTTEDERLKFLLESILSDEKRHHELLKRIMKLVVRSETITEDDWWEFLWSNVPFHGAPGG